MNDTLFVFLLLLTASFIFSTAISKIPLLRIPTTVGYLLFGMALQSHYFSLTETETAWLNHLASFGLLFLMYVSGMEVDIRKLRPTKGEGTSVLTMGISIFATTLVMSFAISLWLCRQLPPPANPYMLALLFSTTSLGVILPVLEETHHLQKPLGQAILVSSLIADFLTMLLISIFISSQATNNPFHSIQTLAIVPFAAIVYGILRLVQRQPFLRRLAGDAHVRIRAVLALLAITAALADFTGAEPILGAFLVGMIVSALPFAMKEKLKDYSHGIGYGFFIPMFFVSVGLDFDFHSILRHDTLIWIPVLMAVAFLVKLLPAMQLRRQFGFRPAIASGFLLSARLSLVAAAAQIGVRIGTLSQTFADSMILVAILTSMLAPILYVTLMSGKRLPHQL